MFAAIGHRNAVGEVMGLKLSGFFAGFLWHGLYWAKMPTVTRKIQIALNASNDPQTAALQKRVQYLQGVLSWGLRTEYHERLTQAHKHLRALNEDVAVLRARYDAFVRARQAAVHSYVGYDLPINRLRMRVRESLQQVNTLMARQGQLIETVAINELKTRGERLERYQTQARYAVADSYDRATRLQSGGGGGR